MEVWILMQTITDDCSNGPTVVYAVFDNPEAANAAAESAPKAASIVSGFSYRVAGPFPVQN